MCDGSWPGTTKLPKYSISLKVHSFVIEFETSLEKILLPDTQKPCWKGATVVIWLYAGYGISMMFPTQRVLVNISRNKVTLQHAGQQHKLPVNHMTTVQAV